MSQDTNDTNTDGGTVQPQPQPVQPGAMMRLVRGPDGHIHAEPDPTRSYYDGLDAADAGTTGTATTPAADEPDSELSNAPERKHERSTAATPWRIWRATDPEPGQPPAFETIDRAAWFGDELVATEEEGNAAATAACRAAWASLCRWIARTYPGCHALRTPGVTGLSLMQHTLPWGKGQPRPYVYPQLMPAELGRLLAANTPIHRMEALALPDTAMRRYVQYDARVAHFSYLARLPVLLGDTATGPIHDERDEYIPYRAGKYRVAVTVPAGWQHIGLVQRKGAYPAWDWPARPGEEWECWLDECQIRLLREQGWGFTVRERILFAGPRERGNDPLREHVERLSAGLAKVDAMQPRTLAVAALRHALRAIALHPIGLWHKVGNERTRWIASLDELDPESDADATITPADEGKEGYTITNSAELSAWQTHWRRPEWSTTVYAREQVAATRRALMAPRAHVAAILGDGVSFADWTPSPDWTDTGKLGCYRVKLSATFPRDRRVPSSLGELATFHRELKAATAAHTTATPAGRGQ